MDTTRFGGRLTLTTDSRGDPPAAPAMPWGGIAATPSAGAGVLFYRMREEVARMRKEVAAGPTVAADPGEAELIARAKAWSPEAWTEIYRTHFRPVYRYVRARVFDEAVAEDLTANVFVAALEGIKSYRYRGRPLLAWLYRLARNVVSTHQRRLLRSRGSDRRRVLGAPARALRRLMPGLRDGADAGIPDFVAGSGTQGDPAAAVERMDLRHALEQLTKDQREVVVLRFLVGLSTREIAAVMNKDPAAVYSLAARALLALRKQLGEEIHPDRDEFRPRPAIDRAEG